MKYSKELPAWLRKRCWGIFMRMTPKMRKFVYRNNFESYCSEFINVPQYGKADSSRMVRRAYNYRIDL